MAVKKILQDTFEQIRDTSKEMAKSSAKQIKETFSPWDMIRNSFTETNSPNENKDQTSKLKELQSKDAKHTPLDFDKLQKTYANQDNKNIDAMKQRLFHLVKKDEEKILMKGKQEKAEKERALAQEDVDKKRKEDARNGQPAAAPQGKMGRGTALLGKKRRKATEPQPAETKPGSGKQ